MIVEAKDGTAEAIYAWHHYYIDSLAVRFRANDQHYFLHDDNFNVTAAYDVNDSSGTYRQVVERYSYTPYGEVTFLDANFAVGAANGTISAIGNNYLYTGRERDPETGLQLNRHRYYHAVLGRWLTRDPIGYDGSPWNLYEYVGGMPTNYVDPIGLYHCPPLPSEIASGEAVPIGDVDGDGETDYSFSDPELAGTGFVSYCYSNGGGMFYVRAPDGCFVHRCPYPRGQNIWEVDDRGHFYGSSENPATGEVICYQYYSHKPGVFNTPNLTICVYKDPGEFPIRSKTLGPDELPETPSELPMPREVPPCEERPPSDLVPVEPIAPQ